VTFLQSKKKFVASLCMAGFLSVPSFATADNNQAVESKLASLEQEVKQLKQQLHSHRSYSNSKKHKKIHHAQASAPSSASPTQQSDAAVKQLNEQEPNYLPFDVDVPGRAFVSTGPYVGIPIQFSGSNLIINSPSVNTDVQLLGIRKSILQHLGEMGNLVAKEPLYSHLLFSGVVEAQANYTKMGGQPSTTDIDVTNVSLDTFILGPSDWILGFIEFSYDNAQPSTNSYRVSNSHVFVNKAFITLGNFQKSPLYGSVGQFYVPFGVYSSVMVSDTLPKLLARTKARSVLLGYQQQDKNAFYASTYIFRGDSHTGSVSRVNNGGINLGYKFNECLFGANGNVGAGMIANIADSGGMQGAGFSGSERLVHGVPAYNLHGMLNIGESIDLLAEYVGAARSFSATNMTFDGKGAKPWAIDTQASYSFTMFENKPSSVGVGYAKSHDALALGLPLDRYSIVFNTSLLRNTLQSLEIHRDREYAASKTATTQGVANTPASGKYDHVVVAQFDYYF
jgi:hypothetical protein